MILSSLTIMIAKREINQKEMKDSSKFHPQKIPGPFSNKKWIFRDGFDTDIHVNGIQYPINKSNDGYKQLTPKEYPPPGTLTRAHPK